MDHFPIVETFHGTSLHSENLGVNAIAIVVDEV